MTKSNLPPGVTDRMIEEQAGGDMRQCSICGEEFEGFGHNPSPLLPPDQRCCDLCNSFIVVPVRIMSMCGVPVTIINLGDPEDVEKALSEMAKERKH